MYRMIFFLLCFLHTAWATAVELHVAVAANFQNPLRQLKADFEKHSTHRLILTTASTGQLYAQIYNGAPFDVFFAADMQRPKRLIAEKLAEQESLYTYSQGQLVLWSAKKDFFPTTGLQWVERPFQYLAMANPKTAPYGRATKETLMNLKLWDKVHDRLVQGNSINQVFQFVQTGNAELGFIALSQYYLLTSPTGSLWHVPTSLYTPIQQGAVVLSRSQHKKAAYELFSFLRTPAIQKKIQGFGYLTP